MRKAALVALLLAVCFVAAADVKVKTRMSMSGQNIDQTVYAKGERQRMEMSMPMGINLVTIFQCDQKRMIQLNPKANTCMITPLDGDASAAPAARGGRPQRGGVVTMTTQATDTGERQKIQGYEARRIKTVMTTEAGPGACTPADARIESDGWYADLPGVAAGCAMPERSAVSSQPGCQDTVRIKNSGTPRTGYPLKVTTTISSKQGKMTMQQEAVEVSTATVDAKIFDAPANCKQVSSYQELMFGPGGMPNMEEMMREAQRMAEQERE